MMMMNYFCGMIDYESAEFSLIPVRTIVKDPYHHKSPTRCEQDLIQVGQLP